MAWKPLTEQRRKQNPAQYKELPDGWFEARLAQSPRDQDGYLLCADGTLVPPHMQPHLIIARIVPGSRGGRYTPENCCLVSLAGEEEEDEIEMDRMIIDHLAYSNNYSGRRFTVDGTSVPDSMAAYLTINLIDPAKHGGTYTPENCRLTTAAFDILRAAGLDSEIPEAFHFAPPTC